MMNGSFEEIVRRTGCGLSSDMITMPSMCDGDSVISIPAMLDIFQDIATIHADRHDIGPEGMKRRRCFWIISKTALHIYRRPDMMEPLIVNTWIQPADRVSCERDFAIYSGEEKLAVCRSIWAVISRDTGRLVHMDDLYPKVEFEVPAPDEVSFARIGKKFDGAEQIGSYTIRSVDIDLGGHMNNVNYLRALLGCFSSDELRQMDIRDVEVNYIAQSYEGETLAFVRREAERGFEAGAVNEEGKVVFTAALS